MPQGVNPQKLAVIPNWADPNVIRAIPQGTSDLRMRWNLADNFVVAYSGNFGRVHEVTTIIDAIEVLQERKTTGAKGREIAFLFVVNGALKGHGVSLRVIFIGAAPFAAMMLLVLILIIVFPSLASLTG